jgi:hypothetical protein
MKNFSITFAAFSDRNIFIRSISDSYFYGYLDAVYLKDTRLSIHGGLSLSSDNLFLSERGKIAFPLLNTLIFHSMTGTMNNYSSTNNSNANVTPDCESVNLFDEKQYDFSKFNEFFTEITCPDELIPYLEEILIEYFDGVIYSVERNGFVHKDVHSHIFYLRVLIDLVKSLREQM